MFKFIYSFLKNLSTKRNIKYSSGLWSVMVRNKAKNYSAIDNGKIAELGCGNGFFLEILAENNPKASITGLDFSENSLNESRKRISGRFNNITLVSGDALNTKLDNASIDRLFCLNTILHFKDTNMLRQLLLEAHRIMKKDALFIFDIRNSFSPIIIIQYNLRKYYDPTKLSIVRGFNPIEVKKICKECNLSVLETTNIGFLSPLKLFVVKKQ